jgi:hypothetical protein
MLKELRKMSSRSPNRFESQSVMQGITSNNMDLGVTANKVADLNNMAPSLPLKKNKHSNSVVESERSEITPRHKPNKSMTNLKFAKSPIGNNFTPRARTNRTKNLKNINMNLKERIQNIKNMHGMVNKYFSKNSTKQGINPLSKNSKKSNQRRQVTPEKNKEKLRSRSATPPNKEKLTNNFFNKNKQNRNSKKNNTNHLNFYKKNANKSYGAIKQLDISIRNDRSISPAVSRQNLHNNRRRNKLFTNPL